MPLCFCSLKFEIAPYQQSWDTIQYLFSLEYAISFSGADDHSVTSSILDLILTKLILSYQADFLQLPPNRRNYPQSGLCVTFIFPKHLPTLPIFIFVYWAHMPHLSSSFIQIFWKNFPLKTQQVASCTIDRLTPTTFIKCWAFSKVCKFVTWGKYPNTH